MFLIIISPAETHIAIYVDIMSMQHDSFINRQ